MTITFRTISNNSEGLCKEKGSKFLSFVYPVQSEAQAKEIIKLFESKYHDARHICYSYRIGPDGELYRMNDAGEPSNTAGKPIYGQILSVNITNVLVVVVRYFGGTKLGVGGLIRAYKDAAADALSKVVVVEEVITNTFEVRCGYSVLKNLQRLFKDEGIEPTEQKYEVDCSFIIDIPIDKSEMVLKRMRLIEGVLIETK